MEKIHITKEETSCWTFRFVSFSCFGMRVTACRFLVYFFRLALFIYIFFPEKIWSPDNFPYATHATSISVFSLQNFWGRTTPWREWWGWGWLVAAIQLPSKNGTFMYFPMLEPGRWFCKFSARKLGEDSNLVWLFSIFSMHEWLETTNPSFIYLNPPRVWNLGPLTTKNRPGGWNLTPLKGLPGKPSALFLRQ